MMSIRSAALSLLPASLLAPVLALGVSACDDGTEPGVDSVSPHIKAKVGPDGGLELDYSECEAVQTMDCGEQGCDTSSNEQAVLDVVMDEVDAAGMTAEFSLGDLHSDGEWVSLTMVYQNDWVQAPMWFWADPIVDEDSFREDIRARLSSLQGLEVIELTDVSALLADCSPELVFDHCTDLTTYDGVRAHVNWVDPDDECSGIDATIDLQTGQVSCWDADLCGGDTPLVVKFDDAPVEFAPAAAGTSFDIAGAGECTTHDWPSAATPWLALDRDQNGSIDSGAELFGSGTKLESGGKASNGFVALAELDTNGDGKISRADEDFSKLVLWSDHDGDKRSTFAEAPTAESMGLLSIDLDYRVEAACDDRDNCEVERASFRFVDGHGALRTGEVADVHLSCQ